MTKVPLPPENIHRIRGEKPDPAEAALDYEDELSSFFDLGVGEFPRFDLVLLGLGADGHTASLFPDTPALQDREHQAVAIWVEKMQTWRITLTLPVLHKACR